METSRDAAAARTDSPWSPRRRRAAWSASVSERLVEFLGRSQVDGPGDGWRLATVARRCWEHGLADADAALVVAAAGVAARRADVADALDDLWIDAAGLVPTERKSRASVPALLGPSVLAFARSFGPGVARSDDASSPTVKVIENGRAASAPSGAGRGTAAAAT